MHTKHCLILLILFLFTIYTPAICQTQPLRERIVQRKVVVPNVVGYHIEQAHEILAETRLQVGELIEIDSDSEPGIVLEQNPGHGDTVEIGSHINLKIAREPIIPRDDKVVVPNVIGYNIEQAEEILARVELHVGDLDERISDSEPGTVIKQNPSARTRVPAGNPVHLVIATKKRVVVPWHWIIGGLIIVLGVGVYLLSRIKKPGKPEADIKPIIQIRPKKDIGTQQIESDTPVQSGSELGLRPVSDSGTQEIETKDSLIINEKREHE